MQIHHRGYVSGDPRVKEAAGYGVNRATEIPEEMDVLIVGTGPAASVVTAQLSRFPSINVRAIEMRPGRLEVGQADGIQARSVETFQAFGFANEVTEEAYRNVEMCFWTPDPENPARSQVRRSLGHKLHGDAALHAWGVMDVMVNTDFPDIQVKCSIQSHDAGNILLIPREGGYLVRFYVDLGELTAEDAGAIRNTPVEDIVATANRIIHPYTMDVKNVAWFSVYEVAHRITDGFDDVSEEERGTRTPHAFIMGDACHTHSAKAGQGMNVSIQDGFNLGWKLAAVLEGRAPQALLDTYAEERKVIAQNLIDFDKEWSSLMAKSVDDWEDPDELEKYYTKTMEFPAGFMTQYTASAITTGVEHQDLALGYPIGKRFKSAEVIRRSDNRWRHLGHLHEADGRWRVYVFADAAAPAIEGTAMANFAAWWEQDPASPRNLYTPAGGDQDAVFDTKAIYQQDYTEVELHDVPKIFQPLKVPYGLHDINQVFAAGHGRDIFAEREISRNGAIVVVRPDQYVAGIFPLEAREGLSEFFAQNMLPVS